MKANFKELLHSYTECICTLCHQATLSCFFVLNHLVFSFSQVDVPQNRGNKRMHKWLFKSTSTTIARVWSSWLVHRSTEAVGIAPKGIDKVFLDVPDETFMDFLPR